MEHTYIILGERWEDEDYCDHDVIYAGPDFAGQRTRMVKELENGTYFKLIVQTWFNGSLMATGESSNGNEWVTTFDKVARLRADIEAAKQVIVDNTKLLVDMGLE